MNGLRGARFLEGFIDLTVFPRFRLKLKWVYKLGNERPKTGDESREVHDL
jgi:hypothetical protein